MARRFEARGFGAGVLWGVVVMGAGLVGLSLVAPGPAPRGLVTAEVPAVDESAAEKAAADKAAADTAAADKLAAQAADKAAADKLAAEAADKAAADKLAADKAAADKAAAEELAAEAAAKVEADKAAADTAAKHKAATEVPATDAAPVLSATPPVAGVESPAAIAASEALPVAQAPATDEVPSLTGLDQALTVPAAEVAPEPAEAAPDQPEGPTDALSVPGQPSGQEEPQRLPQIAPVTDPEVDGAPPAVVAEPTEDAAPATSPAATIQDDQPTLPAVEPLEDKRPSTVLDKTVPGVVVDGLPQVGAEPAPEVVTDLPPIQRYARGFANEGKPLFVILLHDVGAAGMARAELAKLPFAVSFVIDPLAVDASEASAAYRAAGQEVLTLANGIPQGAAASDLETTFATLSSILPESVALVDQDLGGFQDQRPLATLVLPVIKGEGRGLVTYDRGLNAADQIAQRDGVPHAVIFRRLDGEGESIPTIRRYLDRAAFKAAQEGAVVVIGDTREATVAAILEWTIEGKAATVTLAPVTAVLGR